MGGAIRRGAPFSINLTSVALNREAAERVITCLQDFVRDPSLTQKSFFSNSGVAILKDAVAVAGSAFVSEESNSWSVFGDGCNQQVVSDLRSCQMNVVLRRKASRDTSER